MPEIEADLRQAVEEMHSCGAQLVQSAARAGKIPKARAAWEGTVHVFDLEGHPKAIRAYTWSSEIEGREAAVLRRVQLGTIKAPIDAVRAAIVAEYRSKA
jgi:hypothetical protein